MKLLNIILIIFIALTNEIKADSKNQLFEKLQKGGNLIFIRHAYAPGNGDPDNFDIIRKILIWYFNWMQTFK